MGKSISTYFQISLFLVLFSNFSFAFQPTIEGQIVDAEGVIPISANFTLEVYASDESCLLYSEVHQDVSLADNLGIFALKLGDGISQVNNADLTSPSSYTDKIFHNNIPVPTTTGCNSTVFQSDSVRKIKIVYDARAGLIEIKPMLTVGGAPYASVASTLNGFTETDFTDYLAGAALPSDSDRNDGEVLKWVSGAWQYASSTDVGSADLNMNGNKIYGLQDPVNAQDAVTKSWFLSSVAGLGGGDFLRDGSQTATGNFDMGTKRITNAGDPTAAQDLSTKSYVDGKNWVLADITDSGTMAVANTADYYSKANIQTSGNAAVHFANLTNVPAGIADGDDNTQLSEAAVDAYAGNNGYLTTHSLDASYNDGSAVTVDTSDVVFNLTATQDFHIQDGGNPTFSVLDNGKVGIGTANPTANFEIFNRSGPDILISTSGVNSADIQMITADSNNSEISFRELDQNSGANIIYDGGNNRLELQMVDGGTATAAISILRASGNVGIGTSAPNSPLDVAGIIRAEEICDETGNNCKDISTGWGGGGDITEVTTAAGSGLSGGSLTGAAALSVDITGATAETTVATGDEILIYDASATALRKMTRANFIAGIDTVLNEATVDGYANDNGYLTSEIGDIEAITTAADSGLSGGATTGSPSLSVDITTTTAETTVAAGDEILIYDASATALRKMTRANFIAGIDTDTQLNEAAVETFINNADFGMGTNKITGLGDPTSAQDAATRNYVDGKSWTLADISDVGTMAAETATNYVHINGSQDMTAGLAIVGSADEVQLAAKAHANQTTNVNVFELKSSAGTTIGSFRADGAISANDNLVTKAWVDSQGFGVGAGDMTAVTTAAGSGLTGGASSNAAALSVDISGTTAETTIAAGDEILIYDASATALRKMTRANFIAGINTVLDEATVDGYASNNGYLTTETGDIEAITTAADSGLAGGTVSGSPSLSVDITGTTVEATIAAADEILIYDASATALKKMTRANFIAGIDTVLNEATVDGFANNNGYLTAHSLNDAYGDGSTVTVGATDVVYNLSSTGDFHIQDAGNPAFTVTDSGQVGIGTTSPSARVHLLENSANTGDSTGDMLVIQDSNGGSGNRVGIAMSATGGTHVAARIVAIDDGSFGADLAFETRDENSAGTDTDERMRIVSDSGNVGIGTSSPISRLTVEGVVTLDEQVSNPTGTVGYGSLFAKTDGKLYYRNGTGAVSNLLDVGLGTVTQVSAGTGLTGGPITTTGTIGLADTAVSAAAYGSATQVPSFTVDAQGRLTAAANIAITDNDTTYSAVTGAVNGLMIAADKTKLNGIETSATADQTDAEILTAVKAVDGSGSGLDADLLDGLPSADYLAWGNLTGIPGDISDGDADTAKSLDTAYDVGSTVVVDSTDVIYNLSATQDFHIQDNGAAVFTVTDAGNVGVGTVSPNAKFSVQGDTTSQPTLEIIPVAVQTADLLLLKNSAGTIKGSFRADGTIVAATDLTTKAYVDNKGDFFADGSVKMTGFLQLAAESSAPAPAACDNSAEYGFTRVDSDSDLLYVCSAGGWQTYAPKREGSWFSTIPSQTHTATGSAAFTKLSVTTPSTGSNHGYATNGFIPTIAGKYRIRVQVTTNSNQVNFFDVRIAVNGSPVAEATGFQETTVSASVIVELDGSSDEVTVWLSRDSVDSAQVQANSSFIEGELISAD